MAQQLKGKIYWILDDFNYIGEFIPKKVTTSHTVAKLEYVIIQDHMIKFYVCPYKGSDGGDWSYNVNLQINDNGTKYNGTFSEANEPDHYGEVYSELFLIVKNICYKEGGLKMKPFIHFGL
jgi:hypothetical protein